MENFSNTVGFITGGAAGIGLGVARALGQRGMTLVLADIEAETLNATAAELRDAGMNVYTELLDVTDAKAYEAVARRTLDHLGQVHFLFNNAGVAAPSPLVGGRLEDWRWTMDVNLMGVVHGVHYFLPSMLESKEECYLLNTASLAGHLANAQMASYCASKFAVVGYSEVLREELNGSNVGVSVLCPAWVRTRIAESLRNHPDETMADFEDGHLSAINRVIAEEGMSVEELAERVVQAMADRTFNIFSHADFWPAVSERLDRIRADYGEVLPAS